MMDLVQTVAANVRDRALLRAGETVVVGVSGGLDSMVLMHVLARLAASEGFVVSVAHLDHGLRGEESDADRRFVQEQAKALSLDCAVAVAPGGVHQEFGESVEMAARRVRHAFLADAARKAGAQKIALAHHADDQVELFFLRLLRGAGALGLAGMKWDSPSPADRIVRLIRPLLNVSRTDLAAFARHEDIEHREDATNSSLEPLRNRVRLQLIPQLKRGYQTSLARVVTQTMEILSADASCLEDLARQWMDANRRKAFDNLPVAIQRHVLNLTLIDLGIEPTFRVIEDLRLNPGKCANLSRGEHVARDSSGRVERVKARAKSRSGEPQALVEVRLAAPSGRVEFAGAEIEWGLEAGGLAPIARKRAGLEWFDAAKVGKRIRLRLRRAGDRFQPIGMEQPVKLQDLFVNAKVPREEREHRIIGECEDGRIFWVEGLRMGEQFKLDNGTRRRLKWKWRRGACIQAQIARRG